MKRLAYILPLTALCFSCSPKVSDATGAGSQGGGIVAAEPIQADGYIGGTSAMIPKATAFRMNGDYADKVAVTVDANGNLTYFPDPTDISDYSRPVDLGNGWWLNRQGVSSNSVFTRYTFEEYRKLPKVPTAAELKAAIIPGSGIEEMRQLPYSINQAMSHIKEIKQLLK